MAKHKRHCPALGDLISSARCGEERGVRIACADDCEFNPFARRNYDQFRELEDKVVTKAIFRYKEEAGLRAFDRLMESARRHAVHETMGHAKLVEALWLQPLPDGRWLRDCWEATRWQGLNMDERRLFQALASQRLAVLEVHRQVDDDSVEVIDLLAVEPAPFLVVDRALAGAWLRFQTLAVLVYEAPHFHRLHGEARTIEGVGGADPEETLAAVISHLGGPAPLPEARAWMSEHLEKVFASLEASHLAHQEATLKGMDARHGSALYRWVGGGNPAMMSKKFRAAPDFDPSDLDDDCLQEGWTEAWDILERPAAESAQMELPLEKSAPSYFGELVVGSVRLGPQGAQVRAQGGKRYAALKSRFERLAKGEAVFESERIDDLAGEILGRERRPHDPALVPPVLLEQPISIELSSFRTPVTEGGPESLMRQGLLRQYSGYADQPIPLLNDRTPRQAAADALLRPRLIRLMKRNLFTLDERLATAGGSLDLTWLLEELGLNEINFPPPPQRAPDSEQIGDEAIEGSWDNEMYFDPDEWEYDRSTLEVSAPVHELSEKEVVARVKQLLAAQAGDSRKALRHIMSAWSELPELSGDLAKELNRIEMSFLQVHLIQVAGVMHPARPPGLRLHPGRMWHYFHEERQRLFRTIEDDIKMPPEVVFFADCPQRLVVECFVGLAVEAAKDPPRSKGGHQDATPLRFSAMLDIVCFLRAFIRELNHWPVT